MILPFAQYYSKKLLRIRKLFRSYFLKSINKIRIVDWAYLITYKNLIWANNICSLNFFILVFSKSITLKEVCLYL